MTKFTKKIEIDNFTLSGDILTVPAVVDGIEIDFNINKDEFETFCEENDMREWYAYRYNYMTEDIDENYGTMPWSEVYGSPETMEKFLKAYLQYVYDMDAMDIETPLNKIKIFKYQQNEK